MTRAACTSTAPTNSSRQRTTTKRTSTSTSRPGVGSCESSTGGCVSLLSPGDLGPGIGVRGSDAGWRRRVLHHRVELLPQDTDTAFDIYDARDLHARTHLPTAPPPPPAPAATSDTCRPAPRPQPAARRRSRHGLVRWARQLLPPPAVARGQVKGTQSHKPQAKRLTRKQKLARALTRAAASTRASAQKRRAVKRTRASSTAAHAKSHKEACPRQPQQRRRPSKSRAQPMTLADANLRAAMRRASRSSGRRCGCSCWPARRRAAAGPRARHRGGASAPKPAPTNSPRRERHVRCSASNLGDPSIDGSLTPVSISDRPSRRRDATEISGQRKGQGPSNARSRPCSAPSGALLSHTNCSPSRHLVVKCRTARPERRRHCR